MHFIAPGAGNNALQTSQNLENVVGQLLLTSGEFNVADCRDETQIYRAKKPYSDATITTRRTKCYLTEILSALEAQS